MKKLTTACCLLAGGIFSMVNSAKAQDQKVADSLAVIYKKGNLKDTAQMELLRNLAFNELRDLKLALRYAEELIALASKQKNQLYLYRGYFQKGNKKNLLGYPYEAIDAYFKSAAAARQADYPKGEASAYGSIADVYAITRSHGNAVLYYTKAISLLRQLQDSVTLAAFLTNAGDHYLKQRIFDSSLIYFREAKTISEKIGYETGIAYNLGNIGMVYANTGRKPQAEQFMNEAIELLQRTEDYYPICVYLLSMSEIFEEKGDAVTAMGYAERSLQLARQYFLNEQIGEAHLKLSNLYDKKGDSKNALLHYREYVAFRDSVNNLNAVQKIADLRTNFEVSRKQTEVDLLNQEKKTQQTMMISLGIILSLVSITLGTLFFYNRNISKERKRSDMLLLNILPAETAKELKLYGKADALKFDPVTVLFTDFVEFSKQAEHIEPVALVQSIDFYFKAFDDITSKYGLEKIKTIGDSYMCACGLPVPDERHAHNVVQAAKEMLDFVNRSFQSGEIAAHFNIRIGIHTGPVVAGIVGSKKFQYDIWGDTVNIASRMESNSLPGRINMSETTFQVIQTEFECEYRGEIEAKNRGKLKMYFLKA